MFEKDGMLHCRVRTLFKLVGHGFTCWSSPGDDCFQELARFEPKWLETVEHVITNRHDFHITVTSRPV